MRKLSIKRPGNSIRPLHIKRLARKNSLNLKVRKNSSINVVKTTLCNLPGNRPQIDKDKRVKVLTLLDNLD